MIKDREIKTTEIETLKRHTLLVAMSASFLTPFVGSGINLAIPNIGQEYNASTLLLSWVVTGYLLSSATFLLPFGRLADIIGRRRVFLSGLLIFFISSLLSGLSWSIGALVFFRIIQGIGSSMIFGTSMAILTSVFPPQERGRVLGLNTAVVYMGLSLGPVLGGWMNFRMGWQSIFYFVAILSFVALIFAYLKMKGEWYGAKGEKFDYPGSFLYSAGIILFMYGISSLSLMAWAKYLIFIGIITLVIFVLYEKTTRYPILDINLFSQNISFAFSNLAALINYSATFAVGFIMSIYLQIVAGYNSQTAGLIMLIQPVIMALLSPYTGRLSDRVEPRIIASFGMIITAFGLLFFCWISKEMAIWSVVSILALLGMGFALFSSPNTNAVMGSVDKRHYGVASSTLGTMRLTGQAISMAMVTLIIASYLGNSALNSTYTDLLVKSFRTIFIIFTVISILGFFASLARGNIREKQKL
ncbi:MAG: MFS transporter [Peptococcaceae bacterium]|nr:MFS transporter [Peptococcaceae bacterium]